MTWSTDWQWVIKIKIMEEELITFDTAVLAKEKGFNIFSKECYYPYESIFRSHNRPIDYDFTWPTKFLEGAACWNDELFYTPTQSLLQKWLREKHDKHIMVQKTTSVCSHYQVFIYDRKGGNESYSEALHIVDRKYTESYADSYEQALEVGLQEALKLI